MLSGTLWCGLKVSKLLWLKLSEHLHLVKSVTICRTTNCLEISYVKSMLAAASQLIMFYELELSISQANFLITMDDGEEVAFYCGIPHATETVE